VKVQPNDAAEQHDFENAIRIMKSPLPNLM
jgi:hypothetical protein